MAISHLFQLHISKKKERVVIDQAMSLVAILYPLMGIPQVIGVLGGNVEGVSVVSWAGFGIFSSLFLLYGIIHRLRPIIIAQGLWLIIDVLVVIGVVVQ